MLYEVTVKTVESFEGRRIAASRLSAESLEVPELLVGDFERPSNGRINVCDTFMQVCTTPPHPTA